MKRFTLFFILLLSLSILLVGCGKSGGEFIGKWDSGNQYATKVEIKPNGDNFILALTFPNFWGVPEGDKPREFPAVIKDNILAATVDGNAVTATYVKDDDSLLLNGTKYKRQK